MVVFDRLAPPYIGALRILTNFGEGIVINELFPAIQEYLDGKAADWMEHVSDEQYQAA
jgi:hypothetical protein